MKLRPAKSIREILITSISQILMITGFFIIYFLIGKYYQSENVGLYAILKRLIAIIITIVLGGLSIGIPRFLSMEQNANKRSGLIKSGIIISYSFTFIVIILLNVFREFFAIALLGNISYIKYIFPFSIFVLGIASNSFIYSCLRGKLYVKTFNILHVLNLSVLPILIILLFKGSPFHKIILLIGIGNTIFSLFFYLFLKEDLIVKGDYSGTIWKLLKYSFPRIPGLLIFALLFSIGPIFLVQISPIKEAGFIALSQNLFYISGVSLSGIHLLVLPKLSKRIFKKGEYSIENDVNTYITFILDIFLFVNIQLIIFTSVIINIWLGKEFSGSISEMRIILSSFIFYTFFIAMRGVLDALKVKPVNSINIIISVLTLFLVAIFQLAFLKSIKPSIIMSIAFSSSMVCLGILTYVSLRKIIKKPFKKDLLAFSKPVVINLILLIPAIYFRDFTNLNFFSLFIFQIILFSSYLFILWKLKSHWIFEIKKRIC